MSKVLVFDGVCVLCSRWVNFVLRRDAWSVAAFLLCLTPRLVRDPLYRWIARHRYKLFGQRDACIMPTPDSADRFLH